MTLSFDYFTPINEKEEYPIKIPSSLNNKYYSLEYIFDKFFNDSTLEKAGKNSRLERMEKNLMNDTSFVYGEVNFKSMAYVFEIIKNLYEINSKGVFYDLGSGIGRGIISACLCYSFKKYIGIEYLKLIYDDSIEIYNNFMKKLPKFINDMKEQNIFPNYTFEDNPNKNLPNIIFKNDDFLKENLSDASFIFANSTCFSEDLMKKIAEKVDKEVKLNCIIVTTTRSLKLNNNEKWEIQKPFNRMMSWGIASFYIHRKIKD